MSWTDERITELRRLNELGLSCSRMAVELSTAEDKLSRNAVIGKMHRLGMTGNRSKTPTVENRRPKPKHRPKPREKFKPSVRLSPDLADLNPVPVIIDDGPPENPVALLDLQNHHCRYPYGEGAAILFCGKPTADFTAGIVYCAGHARMAYQRPQPRRERVWR